jgi:dihydrofolate reductase
MRKIVVLEFLSLDGVMQAPGGPEEDTSGGFTFGGWTAPFADDLSGKLMGEQMKRPFDLLLGHKTYDIFAGYWPQHADQWSGVNEATKYVASTNSPELGWENSVLITGDVPAKLRELKAGDGPNMQVYGSGGLVQTLLAEDLVDELWLKIYPVTLGSGKRLFGSGTMPAAFKLLGSQTTPSGIIFANYARNGDIQTGSLA